MKSHTLIAHSIEELERKLLICKAEKFIPTLAIVFASPEIGLESIFHMFNSHNIELVGCGTAGEILNDQLYDGIAACLLLDIDRSCFSVFFENYGQEGPFKVCKRIGQSAKARFADPALIVCSGGLLVDGEQIVLGLKAGLLFEVPIYGGLAGNNLNEESTYSFSRHGISDNGLVALVLDQAKIEVKGLATSGWEPFGLENTITRSSGSVIYTINHEPALDVFVRYFSYFEHSVLKGRNIATVGTRYPLQIIRKDGTTVLRSPLTGNDQERTLTLTGSVREGDKFRFSFSPSFEVVDQTIEDFKSLRRNAGQADALMLFSCKGRHAALGPMVEDEVKGIYNHWKKPMAGLFTFGEFGPSGNGVCEFHNETCSLVLLKERATAGSK
mgnify:CR=1 FL=1